MIIINSFFNGQHIVSYDPDKTWCELTNDKLLFYKKTNLNEYNSIIRMTNLLKNNKLSIENREYKIKVPSVISWDEEKFVLCLEYCEGINLEFLLRNSDTHDYGRLILNALLDFFINNKIYWSDFAPRNIIIDNTNIFIVDFEKGIMKEDTLLFDYLRNHVYEEYGLFLLLNERKYFIDEIFDNVLEEDRVYNLNEVESDRCKKIAQLLGYKEKITKKEYLNIMKMIVEVEIPYFDYDKIIFPGVYLDEIMTDKLLLDPLNSYSKEVIKMHDNRFY